MLMRILLNPIGNQIVQNVGKKLMAKMIVLMNVAFLFSLCIVRIVHNARIKGRITIKEVVPMQF